MINDECHYSTDRKHFDGFPVTVERSALTQSFSASFSFSAVTQRHIGFQRFLWVHRTIKSKTYVPETGAINRLLKSGSGLLVPHCVWTKISATVAEKIAEIGESSVWTGLYTVLLFTARCHSKSSVRLSVYKS